MKQTINIVIIATVFSTFFFANACNAEELIVSWGNHNAEPYTITENGKLAGGIIKEIMDKLGEETGLKIIYKETSRKREESFIIEGKRHVMVISNPSWLSDSEKYNWSIPLFREMNIIVVSAKKSFPVKSFEDMKGKRLGTILGYYYPGFMEKFDNREIIREDVASMEQNFRKLDAGRIDCMIDSDILINYYFKKHKNSHQFVISEMIASSHDIQAAFSKHSPVSIENINSAFQKMKGKGDIAYIMNKYR